jgi:hypothetical protein
MKKIAILFIAICSLSLSNSASAAGEPTKDPITSNNAVPMDTAAQIKVLELRLNEIKELDKSELSRSEKKELKTEVKEIKTKMKALSGGVYISAGALIVILILLIILL